MTKISVLNTTNLQLFFLWEMTPRPQCIHSRGILCPKPKSLKQLSIWMTLATFSSWVVQSFFLFVVVAFFVHQCWVVCKRCISLTQASSVFPSDGSPTGQQQLVSLKAQHIHICMYLFLYFYVYISVFLFAMYLHLSHSSIKCFSFLMDPLRVSSSWYHEKHNTYLCAFILVFLWLYVFVSAYVPIFVSLKHQVFFLLMDPLGSAAGWILWKAQHAFVCIQFCIFMFIRICICICTCSCIFFTQASSVFPPDGSHFFCFDANMCCVLALRW